MQQEMGMEENRDYQLPGERFCPMEDELVLFYLKPMLSGQKVPGRNRVVFDCDLYGQKEPWEIWDAFKTRRPNDLRLNKEIYFLTQHKKMSSTDKRIRRTVGTGTWKGDDSGKTIKSLETGRVVGSKKRFSYKNEASVHNGCWILHEFYLDRSLRDKKEKVMMKDYVLCLLRKNGEPKTKMEKKRKQREEEEVLENSYACDDGESTNKEQEEFLEPQEKRQRTIPSVYNVSMPSEDDAFAAQLEQSLPCFDNDNAQVPLPCSDEYNEFAAQLEETLPCLEDDNAPVPLPCSEYDEFAAHSCFGDDSAPSGAEAIGFQGEENGGVQQLAADVQSNPSFGNDYGILYPLPGNDLLDIMLKEMGVDLVLDGASSSTHVAEETIINNTLPCTQASSMSATYGGCTDPSGSNSVCEGSMGFHDGAYWPQSFVEVSTDDEQQKLPEADSPDWLNWISFTPEENGLLWSEDADMF